MSKVGYIITVYFNGSFCTDNLLQDRYFCIVIYEIHRYTCVAKSKSWIQNTIAGMDVINSRI